MMQKKKPMPTPVSGQRAVAKAAIVAGAVEIAGILPVQVIAVISPALVGDRLAVLKMNRIRSQAHRATTLLDPSREDREAGVVDPRVRIIEDPDRVPTLKHPQERRRQTLSLMRDPQSQRRGPRVSAGGSIPLCRSGWLRVRPSAPTGRWFLRERYAGTCQPSPYVISDNPPGSQDTLRLLPGLPDYRTRTRSSLV